jgi:hypothetical protein
VCVQVEVVCVGGPGPDLPTYLREGVLKLLQLGVRHARVHHEQEHRGACTRRPPQSVTSAHTCRTKDAPHPRPSVEGGGGAMICVMVHAHRRAASAARTRWWCTGG